MLRCSKDNLFKDVVSSYGASFTIICQKSKFAVAAGVSFIVNHPIGISVHNVSAAYKGGGGGRASTSK